MAAPDGFLCHEGQTVRLLMKELDRRVSVAPMMDWSD